MAFFEGGLDYSKARDMPLMELWEAQQNAQRIGKRRRAELDSIKKG